MLQRNDRRGILGHIVRGRAEIPRKCRDVFTRLFDHGAGARFSRIVPRCAIRVNRSAVSSAILLVVVPRSRASAATSLPACLITAPAPASPGLFRDAPSV